MNTVLGRIVLVSLAFVTQCRAQRDLYIDQEQTGQVTTYKASWMTS